MNAASELGRWPLRRLQQANHVLGLQPWESTVVYADTPESSLSLLGELAKDERSIRARTLAASPPSAGKSRAGFAAVGIDRGLRRYARVVAFSVRGACQR